MDRSTNSQRAALDRQQRRRDEGLPTVSVFAGPVEAALREARSWANERGRAVIECNQAELDRVWLEGLAESRHLFADALSWLAERLKLPIPELAQRLERATVFERATFLDASLPGLREDSAAKVCRWLLGPSAHTAEPHDAAIDWDAAAAELHWSSARLAPKVAALMPVAHVPVLLAFRTDREPMSAASVQTMATNLGRFAESAPRVPVIWVVEPSALDIYRRSAPASRAKALIETGVIALPDQNDVDGTYPSDRLARSIARLDADGASDQLRRLFDQAARLLTGAERDETQDDPARSAAERFLFERLESLPATTGLFALNEKAETPSRTGRPLEIDLLAQSLRLAVEIDGYFHFRNADDYRRDRRKDFELQRLGYLVVRVLAEDVVVRLEETLETILSAVALRRSSNRREHVETR